METSIIPYQAMRMLSGIIPNLVPIKYEAFFVLHAFVLSNADKKRKYSTVLSLRTYQLAEVTLCSTPWKIILPYL